MSVRNELRKEKRKNPFLLTGKKFQKGMRCLVYSKRSYNLCHIQSVRWQGSTPLYKVKYKNTSAEKEFHPAYLLPYMSKSRYWFLIFWDNITDGTWTWKKFLAHLKSKLTIKKYVVE